MVSQHFSGKYPTQTRREHALSDHLPRSARQRHMEILPPFLLSTLFSYLPFEHTVTELRRVSTQWRDACNSPLAFEQRLVLAAPLAVVSRWAQFFTCVRALDIEDGFVTTDILTALTPYVGNVERLMLWLANADDDEDLLLRAFCAFSDAIRSLRELHVLTDDPRFCCVGLDEGEILTAFSRHLPHLTFLSYQAHLYGDSPSLLVNAIRASPNLRYLQVCCGSEHVFSDEVLCALAESCPHLEDFRLLGPPDVQEPRVTERGLRALGEGCTRLQTFAMENWPREHMSTVHILLQYRKSINRLILTPLFDNDALSVGRYMCFVCECVCVTGLHATVVIVVHECV